MEWAEYIEKTLKENNDFDNISISLDDGLTQVPIPPIVKMSLIMLEEMIKKQGKRNLFIFPEIEDTFFIFAIFKVFYNIVVGKIKSDYDPSRFKKNELLKLGKAVVRFNKITQRDGIDCISVISDNKNETEYTVPMTFCPAFQKIRTKRKLSSYSLFKRELKRISCEISIKSKDNKFLSHIIQSQTHLDSSICVMTPIYKIKEQINHATINLSKISDIFLFATTNFAGEINNISSGQLSGYPSAIFASDLYSISAVMDQPQNKIQSLIIDASNANSIHNQLDVLDDLLKKNIPIVCLTDIANIDDLSCFTKRNFNIWQWNKDFITNTLYNTCSPLISEIKTENYSKNQVNYLISKSDDEISFAMSGLNSCKKDIQNTSVNIMKLYDDLATLTFSAIRRICPFSKFDIDRACQILNNADTTLNKEKKFIGLDLYNNLTQTIEALRDIFSVNYNLPKINLLKDQLNLVSEKNICLVISDKSDKEEILKYWNDEIDESSNKIQVVYPNEYVLNHGNETRTIIAGWFKHKTMRKIIYGGLSIDYDVLLYKCESRWQQYEMALEKKIVNSITNQDIVKKSLSCKDNIIEKIPPTVIPSNNSTNEQFHDELSEIETVIKNNKINRYAKKHLTSAKPVDVIPVSFIGNYVSFCRLEHKIITVSKIILNDDPKSEIELKTPSELNEGDFVAIRESNKDLIKEIVDKNLLKKGLISVRDTSKLWRDAINIELVVNSFSDLIKKLKKAGCQKGTVTIQRWIADEDLIAPQTKEDIIAIAKATENETLQEKIDQVYSAIQEIRSSHIKAGHELSEKLKNSLADELKNNSIDPFNIWNPMDIHIEDIGDIKILKIIDIGAKMQIDSTDVNRLFKDE